MNTLINNTLPFTAYLAADGFLDELKTELGAENIRDVLGNLVLAEGAPRKTIWAQNIWQDPRFIPISSIGDAAKKLRALQRNWVEYGFQLHRRSTLIAKKLPHVSAKPLVFGQPVPAAPLGSWTLATPDLLLAAPGCSAPVSNGAYVFEENKEEPPNRAYLKLWEALTRIGKMPQAGETCLDLGACPGGWTWVLQGLGAKVISVDKAPLAPHIAALPNVTFLQKSAFALAPEETGKVDWLFSDIACYPARLLQLVKTWHTAHAARNFICTIKLQGETDHKEIESFLEIAGSSAQHLYNNKHEITWFHLENKT